MHLIYLKSIDAHVNLDRVAAVHHNVTNYNGQACTQVWFAAPDSQNENRLATLLISDPDDRAMLRRLCNVWTVNNFSAAENHERV